MSLSCSIQEDRRNVKQLQFIEVPGFGRFAPDRWARLTNSAVGVVLDTVDGERQPDAHLARAKLWLHANGIDSLEKVRGIAGTVRCRYCTRTLTAPKSKALMYGEQCARDHGMPY